MIRVDRNIRGLYDGLTVCQPSKYITDVLTFSLEIADGELATFSQSGIRC